MAHPPSGGTETLAWRFGRLDFGGPWGWTSLEESQINDLHAKCAHWETMRAREVFGLGGNKNIPLENLCRNAQKRLQEIELDDLDELWELRIKGKQRLWGTRAGDIFFPIWWDPEHTVCPGSKR